MAFGVYGHCNGIPVIILGPASVAPASGPHVVSVQNPLAGVTYSWSVTEGTGTLVGAYGHTAIFQAGDGQETVLTCNAVNSATGETGTATHRVQIKALPSQARLTVRAPAAAGKSQETLLAWVDKLPVGSTLHWEIEGGAIQGSPDQDWILFRAGAGEMVRLTCEARKGSNVAAMGFWAVPLREEPVPAEAGFTIELPSATGRGMDCKARATAPDGTDQTYQWVIDGVLQARSGAETAFTAGNGASTKVICLATCRKTGTREVVEREIAIAPPLETPQVVLPERLYEGRPYTARVTNTPEGSGFTYEWSSEDLKRECSEFDIPGAGEFPFIAPRADTKCTLVCQVQHPVTLQKMASTMTFTVLPPAPELVPAKIKLSSVPASTLRAGTQIVTLKSETQSVTLEWTLDRQPDTLVLKEDWTGREIPLNPTGQKGACLLEGPFKGRRRYSLITTCKDPERGQTVSDTRSLELEVPGVSVLAGDVEHLGVSYMREPTEGVRPWKAVTGLAWKDGLLYISQGDQHTIRRIRFAGKATEVEEVAGMRGLPGSGKDKEDRLFCPGQLIHRKYTPKGGEQIEEWLVLQPGANCIQAFTEGKAQETMRVLVGRFTDPNADKPWSGGGAKESKGAPVDNLLMLNQPSAMAVHPVTGHVFVADRGNGAVKMFSPTGDEGMELAKGGDVNGIAVNRRGDVFFSDTSRHVVRVLRNLEGDSTRPPRYAKSEVFEVFVGAEDQPGVVGGRRDRDARLRFPESLALEAGEQDYLLIADTCNHLIRRVVADPSGKHEVETIGGNIHLIKTGKDLPMHPTGVDAVLDPVSREIWLVTESTGAIQTIPGSQDYQVGGVALDAKGNLFFSVPARSVVLVRRLLSGAPGNAPEYAAPELFAGTPGGETTFREGTRLDAAAFRSSPMAEAPCTPAPGDGKRALSGRAAGRSSPSALFLRPEGLTLDAKDPNFLLIDDPGNQVVLRVETTLAKNSTVLKHKPDKKKDIPDEGGCADGAQAASRFSYPRQLAPDGLGRVFVLDKTGPNSSRVLRRIDLDGAVSTLGAASPNTTRRGYDEPGFDTPKGIGVDGAGNIYVADTCNRCIRRIPPDGKLQVAAGIQAVANFTEEDNIASRFDILGYLGLDSLQRILVVEPKAPRLRMVDFGKDPKQAGDPEVGVSTVKDTLPSAQVCVFPGSAARGRSQILVVNAPHPRTGKDQLKVIRSTGGGEIVDPFLSCQAFCADRTNRIWAVPPPDPARPGELTIHRYSYESPRANNQWEKETKILQLPLGRDAEQIDGRPYAPCGIPSIAAIATDSRHNLFLADAGNAVIWKVEENLGGISRVAGKYPYLGPIGESFDDPLLKMQGIALTPEDDIVVTCGNAVLQITLERTAAPMEWKASEVELWSPPMEMAKPKSATRPKERRLQNDGLENIWKLAMRSGEGRLEKATKDLRPVKLAQRTREKTLQDQPHRPDFKTDLGNVAPVVAGLEKQLELAQAGMAAMNAGYEYLYLLRLENPKPGEAEERDQSVAMARQAAFESSHLASELEGKSAAGSVPVAAGLRLDYLKAIQKAEEAKARVFDLKQALAALEPTAPGYAQAKAERDRGNKEREKRQKALKDAREAAMVFENENPGEEISGFRLWTFDQALAVSVARQAGYEYLKLARELEQKGDSKALPAAAGLRLDYLKAIQETEQAKARVLEMKQALLALDPSVPDYAQNKARLDQGKSDLDRLQQALNKTLATAKAFEKANPGTKISEFRLWTRHEEGNRPPTDP